MTVREKLRDAIKNALRELSIEPREVVLEHPTELSHGDYATNAALAYAKELKVNPRELAEKISAKLREQKIPEVENIEIAGPGFINFRLTRAFFADTVAKINAEKNEYGKNESLQGEKVMIEYTDPNPFKVFHIGHLMSNAVGEALSRIIEVSGAEVKRACYQGDVGLHVAKAIWGAQKITAEAPERGSDIRKETEFWGKAYVCGSNAFEENEETKKEIQNLNKIIFEKSDETVNDLYAWGRKVSLEHFEEIYLKLGTKFDFYFFESEMAPLGLFLVEEFLQKGIFEKSDGAVIFRGENYGLHTRVFVNSQGLPTYETKELGLNKKKYELYPFDRSIIITANEQNDYFKVLVKAMEFVYPAIANKTRQIGHGMLRFAEGKMSSRKGNIITGESLINDVEELVYEKIKDREFSDEEKKDIAQKVAVGAIKYSVLKQSPGKDIIYDFEKSISFEGDSGPYLQYTAVRARSILEKAKEAGIEPGSLASYVPAAPIEKLLSRFPDIVENALRELGPQYILTYLTHVAASFNSYYADQKIIDATDVNSPYRVALAAAVAETLENGLWLLGICVPHKM